MHRLGVIGKPSDWLISSNVNYLKAKEIFDIELIDIDIKELIELSDRINEKPDEEFLKQNFNRTEISKAYNIYLALKKIVKKYDLEGITVRCFDLLNTVHSTSCLAFAILNKEGIIATCEGDVPSLIGMFLVKKCLDKPTFQANPSQIFADENKIILAHCTIPLNMCTSYKFDTHYESKTGIGIKGELETTDITIFRLNSSLNKYVILKGKINKNLSHTNLCRTQVEISLESDISVEYFLKNPLGNHHLIFYGKDTKSLEKYLENHNVKRIQNITKNILENY